MSKCISLTRSLYINTMFFYFDSSLALIGLAGMLYQSHDVRDPGANILVIILTVALSVSIAGHASYTYENCGTFSRSRYGSTVFIALGDMINLSACFYALWELSVRSANGIHHVLPLVIWCVHPLVSFTSFKCLTRHPVCQDIRNHGADVWRL